MRVEWLVHFPRVESQLCAYLEPRLGRKLADAELVVLMQVSYDSGERDLLVLSISGFRREAGVRGKGDASLACFEVRLVES